VKGKWVKCGKEKGGHVEIKEMVMVKGV